jgi:hypothetical protein
MKKSPFCLGRRPRMARSYLVALLCLAAVACSNAGPESSSQTQPSLPDVAGPGTVVPGDPESGGAVSGAPGEEVPLSTPPASDGPSATETNFITLPPCSGDGSRIAPDAGTSGGVGPADAGVLADAAPPESGDDGGAARVPCTNAP